MSELEQHSALYWALCRHVQQGRLWTANATLLITRLLQSPHERVRLLACDLWHRVTADELEEPTGD
jgi:hypothetical protein